MKGSKPCSAGAYAIRQGQDIRAAQCVGFFPLTPALSLGERVIPSLRGEQSRPVGFTLRDARCCLSLRERVGVRGNGATYYPLYRTIPTVEMDESPGKDGGSLK